MSKSTQSSQASNSRAQYSDQVRALLKAKYPLCKNPADRDRLARECGIVTRQKLYNLASRLTATRPHSGSDHEWSSEEARYEPEKDLTRLYLRDEFPHTDENGDVVGLVWEEDDDRYLREHFGRTKIEDIAFFLNRTETATAYRARQLGLRNIPKYYDARKVAPWLGIHMRDLLLLSKRGLDVFPCTDRHGKLKITLVSTTSIARCLLRDRLWKRLADRYDADLFFIHDIFESIVALQKEEAVWEPDPWVSHGHTSLNPFYEASFGWFYNGHDERRLPSEALDPRDLSPAANVASESWRRGANGSVDFEKELEELVPTVRRYGFSAEPASETADEAERAAA